MFVSYLFNISLTSPSNKIHSVLDFVFEPGIDEINILSSNTTQEIKQNEELTNRKQIATSFQKPSGLPNKSLDDEIQEDETNTMTPEDLSVPKKSWNQQDEPDEQGLFDVADSRFINRLGRSNISPKIRFTPKILSASYPISEKRQKNIQKKIFKFVDKIYDKNFKDTTYTWEDKKQIYEATISRLSPETFTDQEQLIIDVTTRENGNAVTTKIKMKRMAFSNFAHFVDYWDPRVAVHDDEIEGRFHSNTDFSISRSNGITPKFTGKVTTAGYKIKNTGTFPIFNFDAIFAGGLETGVKEIYFPKKFSPISEDSSMECLSIHRIYEETWITFIENGSYNCKEKSSQQIQNMQIPQDRSYFIIGSKNSKIHLQGVVKGKVLVYSRGKIVIDGDLTYAQNPQLFDYSTDCLGIVSQKNIEIAHPSVTGAGDLKIYGAICAKERFRVANRGKNGKATLYIYGSLSAGSISATEPRYATKVVFDKRFENQRPPNFPLTNRYEITKWKRNWEVKNLKSGENY